METNKEYIDKELKKITSFFIIIVLLNMVLFTGILSIYVMRQETTSEIMQENLFCGNDNINNCCSIDTKNIVEIIDTVNKNCGSSFITEFCGETKTESKYCVFTRDKKDGYEKIVYVPLEDCLN